MERPSDDGARPSQGQDRRQDGPLPTARATAAEPGWDRVPVGVSEARRLAASPQGGAFLALRAEGQDLLIQRVEGYSPEAPLALPQALALTALVAEALEPVHDQGGAFGELSPGGIVFDRHGVLRIRPAPRQAPLAEPSGGAITPATDSLGLGGLLRFWLGGGWSSQPLKATPAAGPLSPLGVKVVLEGLSRGLPKLRLQPAGSARQAIFALLRRANLDGDELLRDMLRARGLGVALRAWSEPVRITARAAAVPALPQVTPTGLFAASQILGLSPPIPAPPLFPAAPPRDPRPRSQALLREVSPPPAPPELEEDTPETEELPELPRYTRPATREVVSVPTPPAERAPLSPPERAVGSGDRAAARSAEGDVSVDHAAARSAEADLPDDHAAARPAEGDVSVDRAAARSVEGDESGDRAAARSVEGDESGDHASARSVEGDLLVDHASARSVEGDVSDDHASARPAEGDSPVDHASARPAEGDPPDDHASARPVEGDRPAPPPPARPPEVMSPPASAAPPRPSAPPPTGVIPPLPAPPPRQAASLVGLHTTLPRAAPPPPPPTEFDDDEPTRAPVAAPPPAAALSSTSRAPIVVHPHLPDTPPTELPTAAHEALMHRPGAVVDLAQLGGLGVQGDPSRMAEKGPGKWTEQGRSTEELGAIIKNPNPVRGLDLESPRGGAWAWLAVVLVVLGLGALAWWLLRP